MASWLDNLEARLEQTLEAFLQANPQQEALLRQQDLQDQRRTVQEQRLTLTVEAERRRQELLDLAAEIRRWQERVDRAEAAGAPDLAARARSHGEALMDRGRLAWQELAALGERLQQLQADLKQPAPDVATTSKTRAEAQPNAAASLEDDWARFEAEQELEDLRRRRTG